ncbi:MAG: hypothetical protein FWD17_09905 [Polyangiaceae bacterium]|nr:hypothetical protein [Polyangiaceae bacterium]
MSGAPAFPPFPKGLKGRRGELATLAAMVTRDGATPVALVGGGGSGKSLLACALGHRVRRRFPGGIHWFRSGPWDASTLEQMLAVRFGTTRDRRARVAELRAFFAARGPALVVLDNHENDRAIASLLGDLGGAPVAWVITARRCLLSGVSLFPVVAPLATSQASAFTRVRRLTRPLRHSPLALAIADALVVSRATGVGALQDWLVSQGVERIRVIDHEDDLPEVALLVDWIWARLGQAERRMLAVLACSNGDHVDLESLATLARVAPGGAARRAVDRLHAWRVVQEPLGGRYTVHAVVRYALAKRTQFSQASFMRHYVTLLESAPERLDLEQTHLYAAMDYAHASSSLPWMLRIDRLLMKLDERARAAPARGSGRR